MSANSREQSRGVMSVIWHDVECGGYDGDLELWRELAAEAGGAGPRPRLRDGPGRARPRSPGPRVHGLDLDPELVAALNAHADASGLPAEASRRRRPRIRARGASSRPCWRRCSSSRSSRARRSGSPACAAPRPICSRAAASPSRSSTACRPRRSRTAPPPLPDARELDGWLYSSLPLDAGLDSGAIVVRRLRQIVSPAGELTDEVDEIPLRLLAAETLEAEAREAGLRPVGRREIPPTDTHVGSAVLLLEAR